MERIALSVAAVSPQAVRIIKHETMGRTDGRTTLRIRGESERHDPSHPSARPSVSCLFGCAFARFNVFLLAQTGSWLLNSPQSGFETENAGLKRLGSSFSCLPPDGPETRPTSRSVPSDCLPLVLLIQAGNREERSLAAGKEQQWRRWRLCLLRQRRVLGSLRPSANFPYLMCQKGRLT